MARTILLILLPDEVSILPVDPRVSEFEEGGGDDDEVINPIFSAFKLGQFGRPVGSVVREQCS